ncbi:MAG: glycine cleavage system aminomethyltransferase GcvT [Candidatus Auribacterota bacterium]|jgi:aminomethyltransferase|nr:glycine cleavage system aminomethyltransferase GcvT [Candidatus Auribacterota bacterium]
MSYKTPLYDNHTAHEARMIDFHGWEMPVHYSGILDEHQTVRTKAGIFDLSHMGEIDVCGPESVDFLNYIICNNMNRLSYDGRIIYTGLLNENGGFIDDLLVYRKKPDSFMLVVNAANRENDLEWINRHASSFDVTVEDRSLSTGLIALQGPSSVDILKEAMGSSFKDLYYYHFTESKINRSPMTISRTGYTGEDGFEIYGGWDDIPHVWDAILEAGRHRGIKPIGLGARDTLRLEMRYPLHGSDISETVTPLEAGLSWIVDFSKDEFIGKKALVEQNANGVKRQLIAFVMADKGVPRAGYDILCGNETIGTVTSGTMSPSLLQGIGMGYVDPERLDRNNLFLKIYDKQKKIEFQKGPFIRPRIYAKK